MATSVDVGRLPVFQSIPGHIVVIVLGITVLCSLFFHLTSIGGDFLSDDFVHLEWVAHADQNGDLLNWVFTRFWQPIPSGNFAYRPVAFASYALDWKLFGANAVGWRITNIAIHLINGGLMLLLARALAEQAGSPDSRFVSIAAASLLIAIPFAGESTFWLVGRFDLLACSFCLVFLLTLVRGGPTGIVLIALSLALLAKESAMPIIAVGLAIIAAQEYSKPCCNTLHVRVVATGINTLRRGWPILMVSLIYLAWRQALFGSPWKVYPDSRMPANATEAWERISALRYAFFYPFGVNSKVWLATGVGVFLVWLAGIRSAVRYLPPSTRIIGAVIGCCFLIYLLAPATSFALASPNGEGVRNLYIPWAIFSLFVSFAIAGHRSRLALLLVGLVIAISGQYRLVTLWAGAGKEMARITSAIPGLAASLDPHRYALILLPDHLDAAVFVRNAQGGIVRPPRQPDSYLTKMAPMSTSAFAEWEHHLATNVIGRLKGTGIVFDRRDLTAVYCWIPTEGQFHKLSALPVVGDAAAWERVTLTEAINSKCLL